MSIYERIHATAIGGGTIKGLVAQCVARCIAELAKAQAHLTKCLDEAQNLRAELETPAPKAPDLPAQLTPMVAKGRQHIQTLQAALRLAQRQAEAFRMFHGLMRSPTNPPVILNVLLLGLIIFIEALLNLTFFQNAAMTATPMAALFICVTISSTNILACCCGGFFIGRWLEYGLHAVEPNAPTLANPRRRAQVSRWVFMVIIGFVHLTIGLVRTQESLTEVEHSLSAYTDMLMTPESILLVLTGACLSVLAWHKGSTAFSDPYPYFSAYQQAIENAQEALDTVEEDISTDVEDRADEVIEQFEKAQKHHSQIIQTYNQKAKHAHAAYRALQQQIETARQKLDTDIAHIADSYHSAGGTMETGLTPEQRYQFETMLNVELPEYWSDSPQGQDLTAYYTAKANALAKLAATLSGEPS